MSAGLGNDVARAGYATELHSFDVSGDNLAASEHRPLQHRRNRIGRNRREHALPRLGLLTVTIRFPEPGAIAC